MEYFNSEPFQVYLDRLPTALQGTLLVAFGSIILGVALGLQRGSREPKRAAPVSPASDDGRNSSGFCGNIQDAPSWSRTQLDMILGRFFSGMKASAGRYQKRSK